MFVHTVPRERSDDEAFEAPGRCIYCGVTDGLTLEHIIPDGLYGNLVIPAGSCHSCAKEIFKYERPVILNHYGTARMAMGIHSRKKRGKNYQRRSTFTTYSPVDRTPRERAAHPNMPHSITAVHTGRRPGILTGPKPSEKEWNVTLAHKNFVGETDVMGTGPFRLVDAAKFVSKVAHGYAVGCLGLDAFTPYLNGLIRNESDEMADWYFGSAHRPRTSAEGLHQLRLYLLTHECSRLPGLPIGNRQLVIVHVDMFLGYDMPTYEVVVGEVSPTAISASSR